MYNTEKPLILIVDDNVANLRVIGSVLGEKYKTAVTLNGHEALSFIKKKLPDIILLDIMMPDMSGYEVCRILKADPGSKNIPIIFLTAKTDSDSILKGFEAGAVDYICKPFNKAELLKRVHTHLSLKKTAQDYRTALKTLELSQMKLETVFQNIPEGIVSVDKNMQVIQQNSPLEKTCPLYRDMKPGQSFNKVLKKCTGECPKILSHVLQSGRSVKEYSVSCKDKNGSQKNLIMNCSPLIDKNKNFEGVIHVIRDVTRIKVLEDKLRKRQSFMDIIGKSEKMQYIYTLIRQLADVETNVLVTGESGTGKELVVEAIHYHGTRCEGPLVRVNCSVFPENMLESELFGHVRGAFTGAVKHRDGRIRAAETGTLFLDEIGELPNFTQVKLLRFLERKEYERIGENKTAKADIRIIAATHVDLEEKVSRGLFRKDFYYRLKVMNIHLPPLRERIEDIPLLVRHFCLFFSKQFNKSIYGADEDTLALFMNYHWPGNVRELKHAVEHAFIVCTDDTIKTQHLPGQFNLELKKSKTAPGKPADTHSGETDKIIAALTKTDWNKSKAARLLGIHRNTLYRKILELNISKK